MRFLSLIFLSITVLDLFGAGSTTQFLTPEAEALGNAIITGDVVEFQRLLDTHNELLNAQLTQCGSTALHIVAHLGYSAMASLLLSRGANINLTGGSERATPLMVAACAGHAALVRLLIQGGADLNIMAQAGTVNDYAAHYPSIISMLNTARESAAIQTFAKHCGEHEEQRQVLADKAYTALEGNNLREANMFISLGCAQEIIQLVLNSPDYFKLHKLYRILTSLMSITEGQEKAPYQAARTRLAQYLYDTIYEHYRALKKRLPYEILELILARVYGPPNLSIEESARTVIYPLIRLGRQIHKAKLSGKLPASAAAASAIQPITPGEL